MHSIEVEYANFGPLFCICTPQALQGLQTSGLRNHTSRSFRVHCESCTHICAPFRLPCISAPASARANAITRTGALGNSLKGALAIFFLFSLMIFVFTVLGIQLFADMDTSEAEVRFSFRSPYHAFLTVCALFTGEDWGSISVYTMRKTGNASFLYFLAAFIIGAWIMVSLLISTFVDAFQESRETHDSKMATLWQKIRSSFRKVRGGDEGEGFIPLSGDLLKVRLTAFSPANLSVQPSCFCLPVREIWLD